jgi:hypothetical protein
MPARLAEVGDLSAGMADAHLGASLTGPLARWQELLTEEHWREAQAATTHRPVSRRRASD